MSLTIQRLSYKRIGEIADQFLSQYHPGLSPPIPIEEIAEQKLKLKIREQINLKKNYDVDGFLLSDLTTIFIDLDLYIKFENRTRFTIAHEIGHLVLHGNLFRNLNINSVESLNSFASQVLVPTQVLFDLLKKRLGRTPSQESPEILATVVQDLLDIFQVSGDVLVRRLQKEGIVKDDH